MTGVRAPTRVEGIGASVARVDGVPKVTGRFAYSSDLWADGMLWGAVVRSPHPHARIRSIDISEALAVAGVHAVLTHDDVPGRKTFGLEVPDQPVLAWDVVRYQGEPVALVAADHPETARRAAERVRHEYEILDPVSDPEVALRPNAPVLHPDGNLLRHVRIRRGDPSATAEVVVSGTYETGMQDQATLGPESGLAVPDGHGGVDLYVSTQWLHVDRDQVAASLALPPDKVRITLAGVGGAFGAREDISIQVHVCLLALHTGRPVKMMYTREESFFGHVHRHPSRMRYEHGATRDGKIVYVNAEIVLDGGAYASSSTAVVSNAACFSCGPYDIPNVSVDAYVAYTNNPPSGAMRGFGSVQVCFAYEAQMDKLARALGMDPVELRTLNALGEGDTLATGQSVRGPTPVAELLRAIKDAPMPVDSGGPRDLRELPGGVSNTTHGEGVRRGVGYAIGFKNVCYSEGFDDYSTACVRLSARGGDPLVEVHSAAAEVGQGVTTVQVQIARTELNIENVVVLPADTSVGSAGSSSASRQTYMTGGAVKGACDAVRADLFARAAADAGVDVGDFTIEHGFVRSEDATYERSIEKLLAGDDIEVTYEFRHKPTMPMDPETGRGDVHVQFTFAAHRAVVDVDVELGLVRVVEITTAQDVGKAINPQAVEGQIDGGIAQGLGLALMEEVRLAGGRIENASFTDYLIPTILDMPPVNKRIFELADPDSPYGLRGVGEAPTISSTPAIVAALRAATGRCLARVPVRPDDLVGL